MKIKTLTTRISLVVTILTILVLLATILTVYIYSRNMLTQHAEEETQYQLDRMVQSLSKVQASIESAATYSLPALHDCMDDTLKVMNILTNIVKQNLYVSSASVAYAPNRLPGKDYCMPIAADYGSVTAYYGDREANGEYIYNEWYMVPSVKGEPFWTDPYSNELDIPVVSYAMPINSPDHRCEGVLTLSIELKSFMSMLVYQREDSIDFHEKKSDLQLVLLDRSTNFLTSPHTDYIMNQTLFTLAETLNDTTYTHIGREIVARRNGQRFMTIDDEESVVTWRILPKLQWTALVITPYTEVFASLTSLTITSVIVALLAVAVAVVILIFSIRRSLRPLKRLQSAAQLLGEGKYNMELPVQLTGRPDEIGDLSREFVRMEQAVQKNMNELKAEKQHVKDSNLMLTTLVQNVVKNLQMPINNIISFTDCLSSMVDTNEESMVIKHEAEKAGRSMLQQFHQLNEMASLVASGGEGDALIVIPSNEFVNQTVRGASQLEERFLIKVTEEFHDKRQLPIRVNPLQMETLIYELIVELSKVSNNSVVGFYSMVNQELTLLRIILEAKTDSPIPQDEKEGFFTHFAEQKIQAMKESDYLQLYICYRTAQQQGARLYVDKGYADGNRFIIECPRA